MTYSVGNRLVMEQVDVQRIENHTDFHAGGAHSLPCAAAFLSDDTVTRPISLEGSRVGYRFLFFFI